MIDEMANHATRIRRYTEHYGVERVEELVDTFLTLDNLIDPHSMFMRREPRRISGEDWEREGEPESTRFPAKSYMDRYINPPEKMRIKDDKKKGKPRSVDKLPFRPQRDVLAFLLQHAPLADWEADVLSIIREEAYYFAPQGQTKILNEGWASYWHSTLMTNYILRDDELIDYCEHHAGTLATSPGRVNPYKMGIELLRDIERRWNMGRYGPDYDACDDIDVRRTWGKNRVPRGRVVGRGSPGREKLFQVRALYNDVTFLDEYLTPEFVDEQKLYHYRQDPSTGRMVVVSRDFDKIKKQLLFMLTNHAQPYVYVMDGNYRNRGELYLCHRHSGADLDIKHAVATLKELHKVWKRPVHINARIDDEEILFTFDGEQSSQQHVDEQIEPPAHRF
ncbi:MAG: SpoVR family protein, partial [Phycisphaerae bacterium]